MDSQNDEEIKNQGAKNKMTKRKEKKQKSRKLGRSKSVRSVGSFVERVFKTLGTLARFGDVNVPDAEDDDGGFRDGTPCTLSVNTANFKEDQFDRDQATNDNSILYTNGSTQRRLSWCYGDKIPGVLGLKNHGNTCFMNAVVQCLSNTDLLAEYLGLEQYKADLNRRRVNGIIKSEDAKHVRGEVTEQLASLIRALWTLEYTPQLSVDFKTTVSKYSSQFRGNSQHDALEFLLWLLNRLHEDVSSSPCANSTSKDNGHSSAAGQNQGTSAGTKVPGKVPPGGGENPATGMGNSLRAAEQPSFVQEHFQAQYKSCLTCPHCLKQSNTFDPFLCISLPIPLQQTRPLNITLVFNTKAQRFLRICLAVPLSSPVSYLRRIVADEGKLSPDQVILAEVYTTGFQRSFYDDEDLASIAESDVIYAFQAPPLFWKGGPTWFSGFHHSLPSSPYITGPGAHRLPPLGTLSSEFLNQGPSVKIILLLCNTAAAGQQATRFGPPFLMREDRGISWEQLQQTILNKLSYLMICGAHMQVGGVPFRIRVAGASTSHSYLCPQDRWPLYHPLVDRALRCCGPGGPPHVKLIIEWEHRMKERLFGNIREETVQDSESVMSQEQQSCTLDDCFQLYTKEEQLAPDDAWRCPHCQRLQQGTVQVSLWTLPDILVLHLKRFRQVGGRRHKLPMLVCFPLAGLDTTPHVEQRGTRGGPGLQMSCPDFLYDLYAVCNHHGGMHSGHYTACCKNSFDGKWYRYDDSTVELVPEGDVCTHDAYILFYHRRDAIPPWSASSSVRGSTSSSVSDHWLTRLRGDSVKGTRVSRLSVTYSSTPPDSPQSSVFRDEPSQDTTGEFDDRPFMRRAQGQSASVRVPPRNSLSKVLPLRWSLGSRGGHRPCTEQLVEYLESGRRPRCTRDPIVPLEARLAEVQAPTASPQHRDPAERHSSTQGDGALTVAKPQKTGPQMSPSWRGCSVVPVPTPKPPLGWDPSLSRADSQSGLCVGSAGGRLEHASVLLAENSRCARGLAPKSTDSRQSFLRPGFLRRDLESRAAGGKVNGLFGTVEIQRSHSISSVQATQDSPQRGPPQDALLHSPAHTILNKVCHNSATLARRRPLPESVFQ